jgi:hypothetical protein
MCYLTVSRLLIKLMLFGLEEENVHPVGRVDTDGSWWHGTE